MRFAATVVALLAAGPAVAGAPESSSVAAGSAVRPTDAGDAGVSPLGSILTTGTLVAAALAVVAVALLVHRRWWRLDAAPPPARSFPATWSLGWAMGMLAASVLLGPLLLPGVTAVLGHAPDLTTLGGQLAIAVPVHLAQAALVLLWWRGPGGGWSRSAIPAIPAAPAPAAAPGHPAPPGLLRAAAIGGGGLLLAWPIVVSVTAVAALVVVAAGGAVPEAIAHRTLALIAADPFSPAALGTILLVSLLVPWIEEVVYRGMLQRGLVEAGLGRWPAIGLVAGFFALRHLGVAEPHAIAGLFVLGLAFGLVLERTGRLTAAVTMHAAFNAGNVLLAVMSSSPA